MNTLMRNLLLPVLAVLLSACQSMGAFPTTEARVAASEPQAPALDIQSWQTAEGARVLFVASDALPMLDVRLVMAAGSSRDNGVAGLSSLTSALLGEGAAGLNVDDISRGFEDHGAQFDVGSYRDMGVVELRTLSDPEFRDPVLTLFNQVIATPSFPQDALDRIRTQMMQGLRMEQQVPGPQVKKAFEARCGCQLDLVGLEDGVSMLNRIKLEGDNTRADLVLGIDTNLTASRLFFVPIPNLLTAQKSPNSRRYF